MTARRERLGDDRNSITHRFCLQRTTEDGKQETVKFYFTVGLYPDGRPGEVFIRADKQGTFESGVLDALGIMISMALQHGVPLKEIVDKMKGTKFPPASFTGNGLVPNCTSPLDLLARYLEAKFLPKEPEA